MSLIGFLQSLADSTYQVFHHEGPGEVDEDGEGIGDGTLAIKQSGYGFAATATYTVDGAGHTLVGKSQIVNWSIRESITHNGKDVTKDDIYVSSHTGEDEGDRRIIVEYRFTEKGVAHRFRFKKSLGD